MAEGAEILTGQPSVGWGQRFQRWAQRFKLERNLAVLLLVAGLTSGIATSWAMTGTFGCRQCPIRSCCCC